VIHVGAIGVATGWGHDAMRSSADAAVIHPLRQEAMVRRGDTAILPIQWVYPFMHVRLRGLRDSDARSRASDFSSSATSRRDPGREPDSCPVLEARATFLVARSSWRLATGVLTASPGRGTCVEGKESILRGITAGDIGLWSAGI